MTASLSAAFTPDLVSATNLPAAAASQAKPGKVQDAARQFESILLAQMLKSGREAAADIGGEDEDDAESSTMLEVAEQQFAQMLARQGGIGLSGLVQAGLERSGGKD